MNRKELKEKLRQSVSYQLEKKKYEKIINELCPESFFEEMREDGIALKRWLDENGL